MAGKPAAGAGAAPADDSGKVASKEVACRLLMLTPRRVEQLAAEGWFQKDGRGRYPIVPLVQGYIRFLKDEARRSSKSAAASRVQDSRAREIDLRVARQEHRLINIDEHDAVVDELIGMFTTALNGLPAQVTRDPDERRKIAKACNETRQRLATRAAERSTELRASGEVAAPDAEDDT